MQTSYKTDSDRTTDGSSAIAKGSSLPGADTFNHPDQVVSAAGLTKSQKRMLLASWASDLRTVENKPSLRRLDSGAVVSIDDILEAMTALDGPKLPSWIRDRRQVRAAANEPPYREVHATRVGTQDESGLRSPTLGRGGGTSVPSDLHPGVR